MSFASNIKKELTLLSSPPCCRFTELTALIKLNGIFQLNTQTLFFTTENPVIARHVFLRCTDLLQIKPQLIIGRRTQLKKNKFYTLCFKQDSVKFLKKLKLDNFTNPQEHPPQRKCCMRAYLRGSFLATGSVNHPHSSSYHLEITTSSAEKIILALMKRFYLNPRYLTRKKGIVIYLKEGDKIGDFLNIIGAHPSLFAFENARIVKDMRNSVNRLVNCETANLNKTIQTGLRQSKEIELIKKRIGLEQLPRRLREIAELRLAHPELTLDELGNLLPDGPKSKSTVNHRLRKISQIAKNYH